jgi:hypothetical protein
LAVFFLSQPFHSPRNHILKAFNTFQNGLAQRFWDYHTLHKATGQLKAFLSRQFKGRT